MTCTPSVCFKAGQDGFRAKQPHSMNSFGHLGIEDTRIVCQLHGMCCFKGFCLAQQDTTTKNERDQIKRMITVLERGMPVSKDRWPGHPLIPPRVFGPRQYLVTLPVQPTKPKPKPKPMVTWKPLPAGAASKLVPPETWSDAEEQQHRQVIAEGEVRRTEGTGAPPNQQLCALV